METAGLFSSDPQPDPTATVQIRRLKNRLTAEAWAARYDERGSAGFSDAAYYGAFLGDLAAVVAISGVAPNSYGISEAVDLSAIPGNRIVSRIIWHPDFADVDLIADLLRTAMEADCIQHDTFWVYGYADVASEIRQKIWVRAGGIAVGRTKPRPGWVLNDEPIHNRALVERYGTENKELAQAHAAAEGSILEHVPDLVVAKVIYVLPVSYRVEAIRQYLQNLPART